jgi:predicted HTH transcriptional regulator
VSVQLIRVKTRKYGKNCNAKGLKVKKGVIQDTTFITSIPRNPLIVRIFYRAGFIEELGSGIKRMINSLNDAGLPKP